jgi:hypothetical protein
VTIYPVLPTFAVSPIPLAIPPDNTARQFTVQFSHADAFDHSFALSVGDAAVIRVSPATLTIAAGQTQALASITGLKAGQTSLTLASPTLGSTAVPVFVTGEFAGINTSYARLLGVVKEQPAQLGQLISCT